MAKKKVYIYRSKEDPSQEVKMTELDNSVNITLIQALASDIIKIYEEEDREPPLSSADRLVLDRAPRSIKFTFYNVDYNHAERKAWLTLKKWIKEKRITSDLDYFRAVEKFLEKVALIAGEEHTKPQYKPWQEE